MSLGTHTNVYDDDFRTRSVRVSLPHIGSYPRPRLMIRRLQCLPENAFSSCPVLSEPATIEPA